MRFTELSKRNINFYLNNVNIISSTVVSLLQLKYPIPTFVNHETSLQVIKFVQLSLRVASVVQFISSLVTRFQVSI